MPKNISSSLLSDIQKSVTTLATCVEITRKDGQTIRATSHDSDILVNGEVYLHDIPFILSAIQSGAQLSVDNTELTLFADDDTILLADVKNGLYEYAAVQIFQVNYEDLTHGIVTMRKGWFGPIDLAENRIVKVTITGLLKVLDLEIGRVYQPLCDADLGDTRCKVAVDFNQVRSDLNPVKLGEWVYNLDPAEMTAITVVNSSFEDDGARNDVQLITGWTRIPGSLLNVSTFSHDLSGGIGIFDPLDGSYMLRGSFTNADSPLEHGVYQDIDIITAGTIDTADIDDGKISVAYFCGLLQGNYLLDPVRIKLDLLDADGKVLKSQDTRYVKFDDFDVWRERACVAQLVPGTRSARLYIYFYQADGVVLNAAADRVRFYWWDHTTGNPYGDSVQQAVRLVPFTDDAVFYPTNASFENNGAVANGNNPTISGWTTGVGNWWQVTATGLAVQDGARFLRGGDDGGATQREYTISQTKNLGTGGYKLDPARILLGKYVGRLSTLVGWVAATSFATIVLDFLDNSLVVVGSVTPINALTHAIGWVEVQQDFAIPSTATKVKITLKAKSPVGSGNAQVAFDKLFFRFYDAERPLKSDPSYAFGLAATILDPTPGAYSIDQQIVWRAHDAFAKYDVVASVTDARRTFLGTAIAGSAGTFETGQLVWISGDNAGLRNIVRTWDPGTKTIKLYFATPHPIQAGDRFLYVRTCQRRFIQDCQLVFNNQINFRGFPYLPGRLTSE